MNSLILPMAGFVLLWVCGHAIGSEVRTTNPIIVIIGMLPVVLVAGYVMIVLGGRFVKDAIRSLRKKRSRKLDSL